MFFFVFVPGDEDRVEPPVANLNSLQGTQVGAGQILLIGHATGKSNAADLLKEYLKTHHPDISRRVIATESADLSAVTEPEIEALAKRHMIPIVERRAS